jgi:hypothetical protein
MPEWYFGALERIVTTRLTIEFLRRLVYPLRFLTVLHEASGNSEVNQIPNRPTL